MASPAEQEMMPTSAYGMRNKSGFTLLELLVVLVIVGITVGLVSFNAIPNERQILQSEAQRVALLLQLARDEAIVRNRLIAFELESDGYRFLMRDEKQWQEWQTLTQDDLLRERKFDHAPLSFSMTPALQEAGNPLRIVFGREPVDKPFVLTLMAGNSQVSIHADGIGHFVVN